MRYTFIKVIFLLLIVPAVGFAQNPTKWSLTPNAPIKDLKSGDRILLTLKADIEPGWHLYALDQPEGGPIPTSIKVTDEKALQIAEHHSVANIDQGGSSFLSRWEAARDQVLRDGR
jgi:hypothetical protein